MIAFFCRTPIHVLRSVQLKIDLYEEVDSDIYIFDSFNSETVCQRIKEENIFSDCHYIIDDSYLKRGKGKELRSLIFPSEFKSKLKTKSYDEIFVFNLYGAPVELIYNTLSKKNNQVIVNMVEDGPTLYPVNYKSSRMKRWIYSVFNIKRCIENVNLWWFSKPELMDVAYKGDKKRLPEVKRNQTSFVNTINEIFGYSPDENIMNADILMMEECYWTDGLLSDNSDYDLFSRIRNAFPDKKIVVKLHPRTKVNRFEKEFTTIPANGIPWEVYALNINMEKKILISLSCGTMISTKMLYGEETYSLMLYPLLEEKIIDSDGNKFLNRERKAMIDKQRDLYTDKNKYKIANNLSEAVKVINNWFKEIESQEVQTTV